MESVWGNERVCGGWGSPTATLPLPPSLDVCCGTMHTGASTHCERTSQYECVSCPYLGSLGVAVRSSVASAGSMTTTWGRPNTGTCEIKRPLPKDWVQGDAV
jgi:hypothetical protein